MPLQRSGMLQRVRLRETRLPFLRACPVDETRDRTSLSARRGCAVRRSGADVDRGQIGIPRPLHPTRRAYEHECPEEHREKDGHAEADRRCRSRRDQALSRSLNSVILPLTRVTPATLTDPPAGGSANWQRRAVRARGWAGSSRIGTRGFPRRRRRSRRQRPPGHSRDRAPRCRDRLASTEWPPDSDQRPGGERLDPGDVASRDANHAQAHDEEQEDGQMPDESRQRQDVPPATEELERRRAEPREPLTTQVTGPRLASRKARLARRATREPIQRARSALESASAKATTAAIRTARPMRAVVRRAGWSSRSRQQHERDDGKDEIRKLVPDTGDCDGEGCRSASEPP